MRFKAFKIKTGIIRPERKNKALKTQIRKPKISPHFNISKIQVSYDNVASTTYLPQGLKALRFLKINLQR